MTDQPPVPPAAPDPEQPAQPQQPAPQAQPPHYPYGAPQQPGYPPQPAYPPQPGYPSQGGYPPQPGYPAQPGYPYQGGYPPQGGFPPQPPPYQPYPQPGSGTPGSTIALIVVTAIATVTCYFSLAGIPALIIGIIAATRASADREAARRLTRIGWIVFGIVAAVIVVVGVVIIAVLASSDSLDGGGIDALGGTIHHAPVLVRA